jgi:hypothetical protein
MSQPIQLSDVAAYRTVDENGNGIVIHPRDVQVVLKPGEGPTFPQRDTELDDEVEQILGQWIPNGLDRVTASLAIRAAIAARGIDVYARPPKT